MKMLLIYLSAVVISFNLLGVTAVNKFTTPEQIHISFGGMYTIVLNKSSAEVVVTCNHYYLFM